MFTVRLLPEGIGSSFQTRQAKDHLKRDYKKAFATEVFLLLIILTILTSVRTKPGNRTTEAYVADTKPLTLQFVPNAGQADASIHYLAHGPGYNLYLASDQALLMLAPTNDGRPQQRIALRFAGANPLPEIIGQEKLPGVVNYYLGRDPQAWQTGVPTFATVLYREIYPGIDLLFYGNEQRVEHDLIISPGADPGQIAFEVQGADPLEIDEQGDLLLPSQWGNLSLTSPTIYQEIDGVRSEAEGGYILQGDGQFGFWVSDYDRDYPLVIDPILEWSTYFGGSGNDYGKSITVDAAGHVYLTGSTTSTDFPVINATQPGHAGRGINCPSDEVPYRMCYDAFVSKLDPTGTGLVYSTYIGMPGDDEGNGIAVDTGGNAYVTGLMSVNSESLPDMFIYKQVLVAKLDPNGTMQYGGWFGATGSWGNAIAVDNQGRAYITGETPGGFPTTADAIQPAEGELIDAFVTVLNPAGNQLEYSTYLGGNKSYCDVCYSAGKDIVVDSAGLIYVTGQAAPSFPTTANAFQQTFDGFWKAFVAKIDRQQPGMSGLVYGSFLGGSGSEFGEGIALDAAGKVYVTGSTQSDDFPTTAGAFDRSCGTDGICNATSNMVCDWTPPGMPPVCHIDAKSDLFVAKFDLTKSGPASLVYATYVGGGGKDEGLGIAVDSAGSAFVTGSTVSPDFPAIAPSQAGHGGNLDAVVLRLNSAGSDLAFSTFMGGGGDDVGKGIALNSAGEVLVSGHTGSVAFPVANPLQARAGGWEAFIARLAIAGGPPTPPPTPTPDPRLNQHVYLPLVID